MTSQNTAHWSSRLTQPLVRNSHVCHLRRPLVCATSERNPRAERKTWRQHDPESHDSEAEGRTSPNNESKMIPFAAFCIPQEHRKVPLYEHICRAKWIWLREPDMPHLLSFLSPTIPLHGQ